MGSRFFSPRFATLTACLVASPFVLSLSARADPPPIGYTGPVSSGAVAAPAAPPLGYIGPVDRPPAPPVGYTGPVPHSGTQGGIFHPPAQKKAADEIPNNHPGETLITARTMHADSVHNIVTAEGKVEIVRADYVLHADKVTFNQNTNVMTADGHVAMLTPGGEVEFADHEEITGDMKQAFARQIGILFPDNSRMAAQSGQRFDERYSVANNATYTACNICREHPEQPPTWQMQAATITHDNVNHELYYHDATIDIADIPVAYTPYMSGPDPTVKRLQGFLAPTPGITGNIGTYIKIPYYVDIAPDKDMTIAPTFSEDDKAQLALQYRQRWDTGKLQLDGSFTHADLIDDTGIDQGQQWRGHLFGTFLYDIDPVWRAGSHIQYASDKSYLQRYEISSLDQTTSRFYVEGLKGSDYAALNSYYFQDLRVGPDAPEPIVLPSATVALRGDPGQAFGGRWSFDGNTLLTQRNTSGQPFNEQAPDDTRRLSLNGGWQRQLTSDTGLVTTVSGLLRTDSYWANNVPAIDGSDTVYSSSVFTRQFEQANAVMRYPMARSGDGYQQLLEPIVAVTAAPNVRQIAKQPDEDSLDVEFDETNLFSPNRFTGSDLIEGGSRATYGLRNAVTTDSGARIDIFGGESYDFTANDDFPTLSGLQGHASDYVGRIDFSPVDWFNANYGFRLAQNDFSPQRQDASVSVGEKIFRPSVTYLEAYEDDTATGLIDQVKQATFGLSSTFAKYWTVTGQHTQGFDPEPGPRDSSLQVAYVDECIGYGVTLTRNDTNRLDLSSGTSVAFHLFLKNLGGIHSDSGSAPAFPKEFIQTAP